LTVNPPAPVITSAGTVTGLVGRVFSYQILATNSPTSYGASGVPAGLALNSGAGLISGTPTLTGTSSIALSASNAGGTGTKTLTLNVFTACDINMDALTNVNDVQLGVNMATGFSTCTGDINSDGSCNVIDVQRVVNAVLGGQCVTTP
jgi:hypothetical protein